MRILSRTVAHSGTISHVIQGCFRQPGQTEVILARCNSLQLCSADLDAFSEPQPLFVPIVQLHTFTWSSSQFLEGLPAIDRGKDLVILLSSTGKVAVLKYSSASRRFVNALGSNVPLVDSEGAAAESWLTRIDQVSVYPTSPFILAAAPVEVLLFPLKSGRQGDLPAGAAWLEAENIARLEFHLYGNQLVDAICQLPGSWGRSESKQTCHPLFAVLLRHHNSTGSPTLLIYAGEFSCGGQVIGTAPVPLQSFTFRGSQSQAGSPVRLVATPPSCSIEFHGLILVLEQGLVVLGMEQLLGSSTDIPPATRFSNQAIVHTSCACVENGDEFCLLLASSLDEDDAQGKLALARVPGPGAEVLIMPEGMSSVLLLSPDRLILSFSETCPVLLCSPSGSNILQHLASEADKGPRTAHKDLLSMSSGRFKGCTFKRVDWGGAMLRQFEIRKSDQNAQSEVIGVSGCQNPSLCFIRTALSAPLEAEGPQEARAITGMWCLKRRATDLWHSVAVLSYADASRAVAAGSTLADVSESCGICQDEATLVCGAVADSTIVQITPSRVQCCDLNNLIEPGIADENCGSAKRHSALAATFANLGVHDDSRDAAASDVSAFDNPVRLVPLTHSPGAAETSSSGRDENWAGSTGGQHQYASKWVPPRGKTISAAACTLGLVVVFYGAGREGRLAALRCCGGQPHVKRKRDEREVIRLELACTTPLHSDPSCMDLRRCQRGGFVLVVCLHGLQMDLFHVFHPPNESAIKFIHLCEITGFALCDMVEQADFKPEHVLGTQPAESIHFLPNQDLAASESEEEALTCFQLFASWRTGFLLHFRLDVPFSEQEPLDSDEECAVSQELPGGSHTDCLLEPKLLALQSLGSAPPVVRHIPGLGTRFLAVGKLAALVSYDREFARLGFERLDLPRVRYAVPMFIKGRGYKCHKLLLCAPENDSRLQLRKLEGRPQNASGTSVALRPLTCQHPQGLAVLPSSDVLAVAWESGVKLFAECGRGLEMNLELEGRPEESVRAMTVWSPSARKRFPSDSSGQSAVTAARIHSVDDDEGSTTPCSSTDMGDLEMLLQAIEMDSPRQTENFLVVGTSRGGYEVEPCEESIMYSAERLPLGQPPGGCIYVYRISTDAGRRPTAKLLAQTSLDGPVHSCGTLWYSSKECLVVSAGAHLSAFAKGASSSLSPTQGGFLMELFMRERFDREHLQVGSGPGCPPALATASAEHGGALWVPRCVHQPGEVPLVALHLVACSRRRHPATSSIPFRHKPRSPEMCLLSASSADKLHKKPTVDHLSLFVADASGVLAEIGDPHPGGLDWKRQDAADHELAVANLGAPLLKLLTGRLQWSEERGSGSDILASTATGDLIQVKMIDANSIGDILGTLQDIMACHPALGIVTGDAHKDLRSDRLSDEAVTATSKILDGDLLAQFLVLAPAAQASIVRELASLTSQPILDEDAASAMISSILRHDCGCF